MFDLSMALYVCAVFLMAGLTKGVVGGGLPEKSLPTTSMLG